MKPTLQELYEWRFRCGVQRRKPLKLQAPWYDCDQRQSFQDGINETKKKRLTSLLTERSRIHVA